MEVRIDEGAALAGQFLDQETAPGESHDEVRPFRCAQLPQQGQRLVRIDGDVRRHHLRLHRYAEHLGEFVGARGGEAVDEQDFHRL